MNLVNKDVIHKTFGKGSVINYDDSYINISFKSGDKKFTFPDAFRKYITFVDQKATILVNKKIEKKEEKLKQEELILKKEMALEKERQNILNQNKLIKSNKAHSKIQSVFWCETDEVDEIFKEWKVFIGDIKSGSKKGQPRKLTRMNQNSACLITTRNSDTKEEDRQILGVFMANEYFDGKLCEDGYIIAHSDYRLHLSKEESEGMLFWNYYSDNNSCNKTIWRSGRHRYFDNIWMAQILRDIVILREESKEREYAQAFLEYFCKINFINQNEIPIANGALMCI